MFKNGDTILFKVHHGVSKLLVLVELARYEVSWSAFIRQKNL